MGLIVDLAYCLAALACAPVLLVTGLRRGRHRTDWRARFGHGPTLPPANRPRVLLHAVSVGEVNLIRPLVQRLLEDSDPLEVVVASTTDTGHRRAVELFEDRCPVIRYPLDLSAAVERVLDRVRPDLFASVELEVWPNLTRACRRRGIPQLVVNGRLSERSHRGYRRIRPLIAPIFRRLDRVAAQDAVYADRFRDLGVASERVEVLGTMKWDAARIESTVPGSEAFGRQLGIDPDRMLVVAGSTAPDEHELLHRSVPDGVQLLCAPRRPEWFDEAARALPGCARRSTGDHGSATDRFLLDTMGELRLAYGLATVVVVGRSFGPLHGSDMMEPAALGRPVVVGPSTGDFATTVEQLLAGDGLVVSDRSRLAGDLAHLLGDADRRRALGTHAVDVVRANQGATERTVALIREQLAGRCPGV